LYLNLMLTFPSRYFKWTLLKRLPTKIVFYYSSPPHILATCPAHSSLLNFTILALQCILHEHDNELSFSTKGSFTGSATIKFISCGSSYEVHTYTLCNKLIRTVYYLTETFQRVSHILSRQLHGRKCSVCSTRSPVWRIWFLLCWK
jgi:hypothetical protein